jgi:AcrR family transcriptional regulator
MGVKERQERDRQAVRDAILTAARDLFLSEGYRNVSLRKIAERIEYSPAAIYSYFASKDDIFFALAEDGFRRLASAGREAAASSADPLERLRRALWSFYEFSKAQPDFFELMFLDRTVPSLNQDPDRFEFFREVTARAEADIRACCERGIFTKNLDAGAVLHVLWVAILGAASINLAKRLGPGEDPDALALDVLNATFAGFGAGGATTTFKPFECPFSPAADCGTPVAADSSHDHAS